MADFNERDVEQTDSAQKTVQTARPAVTRRDVAKMAAVSLGALAVGSTLPRNWFPPIVRVAFLPEHAMATASISDSARTNGTRRSVRTLHAAPEEVPPPTAAGPTELPPTPDDVVPADPQPPNPPSTGGAEIGSETQGTTSGPAGAGGPSCPPGLAGIQQPLDIHAEPTPHGATLTWNCNGEKSFIVEVFRSGNNSTAVRPPLDSIGGIRSIVGLDSCTDYSVIITPTRCLDSSGRPIKGPPNSTSFRTLMDPFAAPYVDVLEEYTYCDGFYVDWTEVPCASGYEVQIFDGGVWKTSSHQSYERSVGFSGLCPATRYPVRVRAIDSRGAKGQWSGDAYGLTRTESDGQLCPPCDLHSNDNRTY